MALVTIIRVIREKGDFADEISAEELYQEILSSYML
jgi:cell division FtsZ-interacting protein ZapD